MTTLTVKTLESLLTTIGIDTPIPMQESWDILNRPLDIPRAYLASSLQSLVPEHAANAHSCILAAPSIDGGDLCINLRRLDHKCDAEELGEQLLIQVRGHRPNK